MSASTVLDSASLATGAGDAPQRLIVTWRDPSSATYDAVGVLECSASGCEFAYLAQIRHIPGFQPFLDFSDPGRRYRSASLFPLFAEPVMDPTRPEPPSVAAVPWPRR